MKTHCCSERMCDILRGWGEQRYIGIARFTNHLKATKPVEVELSEIAPYLNTDTPYFCINTRYRSQKFLCGKKYTLAHPPSGLLIPCRVSQASHYQVVFYKL